MEEFQYFNQLPETAIYRLIPALEKEAIVRLCSTSRTWRERCSNLPEDFWKPLIRRDNYMVVNFNTLEGYNNYYNTNFDSWYDVYRSELRKHKKSSDAVYAVIDDSLYEVSPTPQGERYIRRAGGLPNRILVPLPDSSILPITQILTGTPERRIISVSSAGLYVGVLLDDKTIRLYLTKRIVGNIVRSGFFPVRLRHVITNVVDFAIGPFKSLFLLEDGTALLIDNNEMRSQEVTDLLSNDITSGELITHVEIDRRGRVIVDRKTYVAPEDHTFVNVFMEKYSPFATLTDGRVLFLDSIGTPNHQYTTPPEGSKIIKVSGSNYLYYLLDTGQITSELRDIFPGINSFTLMTNSNNFNIVSGLTGRTVYMRRPADPFGGIHVDSPIQSFELPEGVRGIDMSMYNEIVTVLGSDDNVYYGKYILERRLP